MLHAFGRDFSGRAVERGVVFRGRSQERSPPGRTQAGESFVAGSLRAGWGAPDAAGRAAKKRL